MHKPQRRHPPAIDTPDNPLPKYEYRVGGGLPPQHIIDLMTSPGALRARAAIRLDIVRQDQLVGDTWAEQSNLHIAHDLLKRARQKGET
jgi:hypothetical protein